MNNYKVVKKPGTSMYFVVGYIGQGQWMQISEGQKTKKSAEALAKNYTVADRDAKRLVSNLTLSHQLD